MATTPNQNSFSKGTDLAVIILYFAMIAIGILCIFMVEYNPNSNWSGSLIAGKNSYSKQIYFAIFCSVIGIFILLLDSKVFTALANILYGAGILLMLATFVIGKNINGVIVGYLLQVDLIYSLLSYAKFLRHWYLPNLYLSPKPILLNLNHSSLRSA